MNRVLLVMVISGLLVLPLDTPAAENTTSNQNQQNSIKETISDRYLRLPVCHGGSSRIGSAHTLVDAMVKDRQGRDIGMVENLIMDTKTEKVLFV
ncbi:MAG: hypothetical protein CV090_06840, partial [Nitrospira sp. WS238]|nr:hypothetical protein [Nitrospira sp. WS238]